jgi:hypothetical protein
VRTTTEHVTRGLLLAAAVTALTLSACSGGDGPGTIPQATPEQLAAAGLEDLRLAPPDRRVDLTMPSFSDPTEVTNPLFPIARLRSTVLSGHVEGEPFKTETTLLPQTRIVEWPEGRSVETLISQYVAYLDGRIEEVALDYYAQADDGSVWYFGEDVFNYRDGVIADTEGTWLAGREGPAAMIMPAEPKVGDVYRPENAPGLVFEEVTIGAVGRTVQGPRGAVTGAIIADELHQDGQREAKTFAPGYGEFFTGAGGDVEAMSLAVPVDARRGAVPRELEALAAGAAAASAGRVDSAWRALRAGDLPPRLRARLEAAVARLSGEQTAEAALDVLDAGLDLQLRYRQPAEIDRARFALWARRLVVDADARNVAGVSGDLATLEWIRDRFAHTLDPVVRTRVDANLVELRSLVNDEDLRGAAASATRLRQLATSS